MTAAPGAPSAGPDVAGLHLSMGDLPLSSVIHELIARQLGADEGIEVDPEVVVVTTGRQEGLFRLRVRRRHARDVPPTVTPARAGVTGAARLPVHPVTEAPDGGDLADQWWRVHQVRAAGPGPRALYVVTDHANSYGIRTALPVRRDLLDLAAREGVLLLEDNPYGLFLCPGRRLPNPKALHTDRSIEDGPFLAEAPTRAESMVTLVTSRQAQAVTGDRLLERGRGPARAVERETTHPPESADGKEAMRRPRRTAESSPLGRDGEIELILRCATRKPGSPQALLLLGEEGIGRTTLLRHVREVAADDGVLVLSAQGWAADRRHARAWLQQLLAPVLDELPALPAVHGQVLSAALDPLCGDNGLSDAQVQAAVLALLDRLATSRPVLVCVDDAHACDRAFLDSLCAAPRLLAGRPVTVLLAAPGDGPLPSLPPGMESLHLGPLSVPLAAALLDRQPAAPTGRRRLEILEEAEGNPLALVELSRRTPTPAQGGLPGVGPARCPPTANVFGARLDALPPETGRALLYAAAAGPGETVAALMAALDTDDLAVWAPAEAAGLVALVEDRLVFRHPLVRSGAFLRRPAGERHRAHLDLAGVATQSEVRARHLAAATVGTSEPVAAALEDSAWRRGDAVSAARALEQAARLSPQRRERARRLGEALVAAHAVGDPGWVRDLYGRFVQVTTDPERACVATGALASALSQESTQREAFEVLADVSAHFPAIGRPFGLALAALAAGIAAQSGLPEHKAALSTLLDRAREADPRRPPVTGPLGRLDTPDAQKALEALVTAVLQPADAARLLPRLGRPRRAWLDAPDDLACRMAIASVAYHADEADVCLGQFRKADAHLRTSRAFGIRAWSVLALLDTLVNTGRFTQADSLIRETGAEAAVLRLPRLQADLEAQALTLLALRGAVPPEPWLTPSIWHAVSLDENRATHARLLRAQGLASMALGDWDGGWRHLRELFTADGSSLHSFLSPRSIAELAVTAQRTGRSQEVVPILARVRAEQGERPSTRMTLLLHHATALVDPDDDAEQHFHLALVNHEADRWPWERAHVRLNYGVWLRRCRRTREARQQLTAALECAERLGAGALAAAARRELRAGGAAPTPENGSRLEQLTAQQWQIVEMAARGLSNREIGERLFLSPRTVGTHLYNVYPKLGISSRHQLRDLLQGR
ncbi:AAA family ATPase [Streptomyces mirabilis]|uniref:AAA family ATPase n=1 Tax=Streptomyces mirabilis TaxID=68239 RepID=UPI0036B9D906